MTGIRRILTLCGAGLFGLALTCASCGGKGGGGGTPDAATTTGPATAMSGCSQLATLLCTRDKDCNVPDASAQNVADCIRLQGIAYSCDLATAASDFTSCLKDVRSLSCESLFNALGPPASCGTPLNMVPLSDPQTKCGQFVTKACMKSATCDGITLTPTDLQNCELDGYDQIGCALAITVGATYAQCLTDFGNAPCLGADGGASDGGTTIPSCETAIMFAM